MTSAVQLATIADLDPEDERRLEIVDGQIVEKAAPTWGHADAQNAFGELLRGPFQRGRGGPGGWWLGTEIDIELAPHQLYRPDVAGWRKEHVPRMPRDWPVRIRPDWVCEILSPSTAGRDQVVKFRNYAKAGVGHVWFIHPETKTLAVHRLGADGNYTAILLAECPEVVRAAPFDAIEIALLDLFGADEPEAKQR